jgi:putative CocE/NonD family hydrolase
MLNRSKLAALFFSLMAIVFLILRATPLCGQNKNFLENNYQKNEFRIPMRDGIKLFTAVYTPKDKTETYPILLWRTPYGLTPYGEEQYVVFRRETWHHFAEEGYIIVFQDVRGKFMSEGKFINMRPYIANKHEPTLTDESSDAYDTIEWLIKHIPHNNGRVGIWGISYPGFYAAMAALDAHPALKAVSPQAPIADWFTGDDIHHNGAFALAPNFPFFYIFGKPRPEPVTEWPAEFNFPTPDGYQFYLDLGPVKNVNNKYLFRNIEFWNQIMMHGTYDSFWKSRNLRNYLKDIKPAVMVVGGWFDAENAYGALETYKFIDKNNPETSNILVMGPWYHGGWVRSDGSQLGDISFGSKTGEYYVKNIELPFFNYYLKDKGKLTLKEAHVFETGSNRWKSYDQWPPKNTKPAKLYLHHDHSLSLIKPTNKGNLKHEYLSDPSKPVPFTSEITTGIPKKYMIQDQRFAATRPDVLVYKSEVLERDITIVGPPEADLFVSTSGTDCDWIVKLIDVFPDNLEESNGVIMGGYQVLVRAEIMRSKFRSSYEKPEPMVPNAVTHIRYFLNDVNHTFRRGHRIMIQIQSTWFPLFDRNPQTFTDIYRAKESDFRIAIQCVFSSVRYPSGLIVKLLD